MCTDDSVNWRGENGLALMGSMVVSLALVVLSGVFLEMVWQESVGADAGKRAAVAQHLADGAGEIVIGWFHDPEASPRTISTVLARRFLTAEGTPTFFDSNGRSQFAGSEEQPDIVLDGSNPSDHRILNDPETGLFKTMTHSGVIRMLKLYAPAKPGMLCTVEATVETRQLKPFRQSITMQLEAVELPALRAGLQSGRNLALLSNGSTGGGVHWGAVRVGGSVTIRTMEEIPALNSLASVTGQSYDESLVREDRWMEMWAGGEIRLQNPSGDTPAMSMLPNNVHALQSPTPGMALSRWGYDLLKHAAMRFGNYYAIDRQGLLYQDGVVESGHGLFPDQVFGSRRVGEQLGLIFIDTLDGTAPRGDNLGTLHLGTTYFEGVAVIQGHVVFGPSSTGRTLKVQAPQTGGSGGREERRSIDLTGVNLNGVLYAAGNIMVSGAGKVYGAVIAEGDIRSTDAGAVLEVWHDEDMSRGLFRGVPLVARAPGTWMARY
jgi:hypothetical protein